MLHTGFRFSLVQIGLQILNFDCIEILNYRDMMVIEKVRQAGAFGQKVVHKLPKEKKQNIRFAVQSGGILKPGVEKRLFELPVYKKCESRHLVDLKSVNQNQYVK